MGLWTSGARCVGLVFSCGQDGYQAQLPQHSIDINYWIYDSKNNKAQCNKQYGAIPRFLLLLGKVVKIGHLRVRAPRRVSRRVRKNIWIGPRRVRVSLL